LFDFRKEIIRIAIERQLADELNWDQFLRPDLGGSRISIPA